MKLPISSSLRLIIVILLVVLIVVGIVPDSIDFASGAFTTTSTDVDGNNHLASNTVNDTVYYDTAKDSPAANQAVAAIDPNWKNGVVRKSWALEFDGSNDYVEETSDKFDFDRDDPFSLEAWIRSDTAGINQAIMTKMGSSGAFQGWAMFINTSDKLSFFLRNDTTINNEIEVSSTNAFLVINTWMHVAVTYNGSSLASGIKMYVDGVSIPITVTTDALSATITNASNFNIGARNSTNNLPFNGVIDEARISGFTVRYNGNFTPQRRFVEDEVTSGLYHMDDGTGTTVGDSGRNARDITLGASTAAPTWVNGPKAIMDGFLGCSPDKPNLTEDCTAGNRTGAGNITVGSASSTTNDKSYEIRTTASNGLDFDGTADFANIPDDNSLDLTSSMTVEAWVKVDVRPGATDWDGFVAKGGNGETAGANHNYILGIDGGVFAGGAGIFFLYEDSSSTNYMAKFSTTFAQNTWTHLAGVYDDAGDKLILYQNGIEVASTSSVTATPNTQAQDVTIGVNLDPDSGTGMYMDGKVDEVRISSNVRYPGGFTPARRFSTDASTVGLWHLDEGTGQTIADTAANTNDGTLGADSGSASDDPSWVEAIPGPTNQLNGDTSVEWSLPGYAFREQMKITNNVASGIDPGYGIETTKNRGTVMDNKQTRADGKDWRIFYQPTNTYRSIDFDGSDDYIDMEDITALDVGDTADLTISGWFYRDSFTSDDTIVAKRNGQTSSDTGYIVYIDDSDDKLYFEISDGADEYSLASTSTFTVGAWTHFAIAWDQDSAANSEIFINGVDDNAADTGTIGNIGDVSNTADFRIGSESDTGEPFDGKLDEIAIANNVRYLGNFTSNTIPEVPSSNIIGLWHLDEGSGSVALDSSSTAAHGALSGTPTRYTTDGRVVTRQEVPRFIPHGHGLVFDGSGDTVRNSSAIISAGPFTIDVWFKNTDFASTYTLVALGPTSGSNIAIQTTSGSKLQIVVDGSTTVAGSTNLTVNTWYHAALTYDANRTPNKTLVYLNGNLEISQNVTASFSVANITAGGSSKTVSDTIYTGVLDEIRISDNIRYRNNFSTTTSPFAKDTNTKLLWHIDENSGDVTDYSGNGYTGTVTGAAWSTNGGKVDSINQTQFTTIAPIASSGTDSDYYLYYGNARENSLAQTYVRYGLHLDGTNDYVTTTGDVNTLDVNDTADLAISGWFNRDTATSDDTIVAKRNGQASGDTGYIVYIDDSDDKLYFEISDNTDEYSLASAATFTSAGWHHFIIVWDQDSAANSEIFIDGVDDNATDTGTIGNIGDASNGVSFRIGAESDASEPFDGKLDEIRVYSSALSASEVAALYSNAPVVSNSSLIGHWKLDDTFPAGTSAADSSPTGATGALTNFNFDQNSNWIVNPSLQDETTEPTITFPISAAEQETPMFYQWRQTGGTFSTRAQIPTSEAQLGSEGVYVRFNPRGKYSRHDYYQINSWAVEAFSTSAPARGKRRSFPDKAYLVADGSALNVIDAENNLVWMRFGAASNNVIGANAPLQIAALNGRIYIASADGLTEIQLDLDDAHRYVSGGNGTYAGNIADRADAAGYGVINGGAALVSTTANDVSVTFISNQQRVAVATNDDMTVLNDATQATVAAASSVIAYDYAQTTNDNYTNVVITSGGELYGSNSTDSTLDRYTDTHSDVADQVGTADITYSTSSTPALRNGVINDISLTETSSIADNNISNTISLATNTGVEVIQEHSTQSSGFVDHYDNTGSVGNSKWSQKLFGNSLDYNGTSHYVNVPHSSTFNVSTSTDFTVEFWMKAPAQSFSIISIVRKDIDSAGGRWGVGISSDKINAFISDGTNTVNPTFNTTITDNIWHHIALTYDRDGNLTCYIDGVSDGGATSIAAVGSPDSAEDLWIGNRFVNPSNYYYTGLLDEVRISNNLRYTGTFTPSVVPFTPDVNTLALYHMGARTGQSVPDVSLNANHGTLGANSTVSTDDPFRVSASISGTSDVIKATGIIKSADAGSALNFDGSNDWIDMNDVNALDVGDTADITLSGWFNRDTATSDDTLIAKRNGQTAADKGYVVYLDDSDDKLYFEISDDTDEYSLASTTTFTGTGWKHFTIVWDQDSAANSEIYINGVDDNAADTGTIGNVGDVSNAVDFRLGAESDDGEPLDGSLDDIRVYNTALTAEDAALLYSGGAGTTDTVVSGALGWWKLNEGSNIAAADSSGNAYSGTLSGFALSGASSNWISGSPVRERSAVWMGANDSGADDGSVSAASQNSMKQLVSYTTTNSSLPDNDVSSIGVGAGGLAIVGTDVGAWPAGKAGTPVDDTAATPAAVYQHVRLKGNTRLKGGTRLQ